jgi:acetyltransferase-like isoleucine patch superfamily enzyme
VTVVEPCNLYGCILSDNVFVGPFCEIQSEVIIGAGTKVQSHTFICSLVTIGRDCFIGHGVMFVNDTFSKGGPARGDKSMWKDTLIGDNVAIGSNSTILPVTICSGAVIGAGAAVVSNIDKPGVYVGNPARLVREF